MKKIAVIGAGTMGSGIALVFAQAGIKVNMVDIKEEFLQRGNERIQKFLEKGIKKEKITQDEAEAIKKRIYSTTDLEEAVKDVQLVIEAIIENVSAKKDLFSKLDEYCPETTIFASNTSAISISDLASVTNRQEKFLGMHFFNPPPIMKLVEIIKGKKTSEETINIIMELCSKIGKVPVPSNEAPGFIVNRLLWQFLNESYKLLEKNVATIENIDQAVKLGLNHPMGPFELSDYIGLDVMLYIGDYIASELGEKYAPANILKKMVEEGKLGRKTGEGFYKY
ncbi:MAG: 3-hydroxyacyl-CoA dehydrogenase family protein [Candidatus Heimdallarchaeaceae archaeon]